MRSSPRPSTVDARGQWVEMAEIRSFIECFCKFWSLPRRVHVSPHTLGVDGGRREDPMHFLSVEETYGPVFKVVLCVPCRLKMAVSKFPVKCPLCRREYVTTTGEDLTIVRETAGS